MTNLKQFDYLIIGGATKSGTTSVFLYLGEHPQVCVSNIKETRFFLDKEYPLESKYRFDEGLDYYERYFNHCSNRTPRRCEATPDYLFSINTPQRIRLSLPKVKLAFILREPEDRLISWYRFAQQKNLIDKEMTFEEYVLTQYNNKYIDSQTPQPLRALDQGRYYKYLENYYQYFSMKEIIVLSYELLKRDPLNFMMRLCNFWGIDYTKYTDYKFEVYNPSQFVKNPKFYGTYSHTKRYLRLKVHNKPKIREVLRNLHRKIDPFILKINKDDNKKIIISSKIDTLLKDYYYNDKEKTKSLFGYDEPNW